MGKPTKETVLKAIKGSGAVVSTVAKKLGVTWHTAQNYINSYPETIQAFSDEQEEILDLADKGLYRNVAQGDLAAIKWLQSTKGKKRGYIVTAELTGKDGEPINPKQEIDYNQLSESVLDAIINAATNKP